MQTLKEIHDSIVGPNPKATDKGRGIKTHLDLYEELFSSYRGSASKVFELGVQYGGSIAMWSEYFHNARIYALDNRVKTLDRIRGVPRVVPVEIDQSSSRQLKDFGEKFGPFDIGIDDASHLWSHQILTFEELFPFISDGGLYVVEDTLTSYQKFIDMSKASRGYADHSIDTVSYFKNLIDEINFDGYTLIKPESYTYFQKHIDWISFRHNSIVIKKSYNA